MPQISVIVPVYNVEKYLNRCIDSILSQTFTDFELILVDDGSTDNSGKICDEYAKQDSRIIVIHKENGGLSSARNSGIDWAFENSKSDWLTFIDSDDWVHFVYLERLYNAAKQSNVQISVCGFERTSGESPAVDLENLENEIKTPEEFFVADKVNAIVAWGKLYHKNFFKSIRYPVGKIHEDEFTTYKLLFAVDKIVYIEAPLYTYFTNPEGIMNSKWSPEHMVALDAYKHQMDFFEKNNYTNAHKIAFFNYLWTIHEFNDVILNYQPENMKLIVRLQKQMKKLLSLGRKKKYLNFWKYVWAYEIAYPLIMRVLWHSKAFQRKFEETRSN